LASARQREQIGGEPCTRCADRIEWIVFAAQPPLGASVAADLEHHLVVIGQVTSEPSAVRGRSVTGHADKADKLLIKPTAGARPASPCTPGRFIANAQTRPNA